MKTLPTLLGVEVERRTKRNSNASFMTIAYSNVPPKFESCKNKKKNIFKREKGKNFKFPDKNKKDKGEYLNSRKFGYYQFNCLKKKNDSKFNNGGSKDIICVVS